MESVNNSEENQFSYSLILYLKYIRRHISDYILMCLSFMVTILNWKAPLYVDGPKLFHFPLLLLREPPAACLYFTLW